MKRRRQDKTVGLGKSTGVDEPVLAAGEAKPHVPEWLNTRHDTMPRGRIVLSAKDQARALDRSAPPPASHRHIIRAGAKAARKFGTFTSWQADGIGGFSFHPATSAKPGRKPAARTLELLEQCAELVKQGKPDWPLALQHWPNVKDSIARERLRVLKSKQSELWESLLKK
ncbi:MAG: hypothetical protein WAL95_04935 [Candidatus Acidiferrales bacterium]